MLRMTTQQAVSSASPSETPRAELDAIVSKLAAAAPAWADKSPSEIADLLVAIRGRVMDVAADWVEDAREAKGLAADSPLVGEEWISGPWALLAGLNGLIHTLRAVAAGKDPLAGQKVTTRPDGQVVVQVLPATVWDTILLNGFHAEVWQQPEVTRENLRKHVAERFQRKGTKAAVSLILGAGNINSIPPLDALYKLVAEGEVCIVKLNPINDYLAPHLTHIFAPVADYCVYVKGEGSVGAYLSTHAGVDSMHITGSGRTHDAIVFGTGEEGAKRKAANEPLNPRPMTSELGGVGPTIVVPGDWSEADFHFQAENLVTQKLHNAGCNCIASQILILPDGWSGTDALLRAIEEVVAKIDSRPAYYRGNDARIGGFLEHYPDATRLGASPELILAQGLDPSADEYCFTEEAFGKFWGVVRLAESEPEAFLSAAVDFANDKLMGTLGAQLVIHPSTEEAHAAALDRALADLRYGTIAVNAWSGVGFLVPGAMWGAFPGHPLNDVQSGIGVVHNAFLFDRPQKTVVRAPFWEFPRTLLGGRFHWSPKPFWFVTHGKADSVGRNAAKFEATRNVALLAPIFGGALTG